MALVAKQLEGGRRGHTDRGRLFERQVGRLRDEMILCRVGVLGERASAPTEDFVAWPKALHVLADRLDRAGHIRARHAVLRLAQARAEAHDERDPRHEDPVTDVDGRRMDADQHLVVTDLRLVDVLGFQDLG